MILWCPTVQLGLNEGTLACTYFVGIDPPTEADHSFYMDFEPEWGIPLSVRVRLQFNVLVENNGFSWFNNIHRPVVLPFLYIDAGFTEPTEDLVDAVKMLHAFPEKAMKLTVAVGVSLGLLLLVPILVLRSRYCCLQNQKTKEENKMAAMEAEEHGLVEKN